MRARVMAAIVALAMSQGVPPSPASGQPADHQPRSVGKQTRRRSHKLEASRRRPPNNLAVVALKTVIEDADIEELAFEDFVQWLRRRTRANVVVRWKVLAKAGIQRDCPINLKLRNVTVRKLLPLVFDQLTEGRRSVELAVKADGNTLIFSTRADINAKLLTRSYDVQDLLVRFRGFSALPVDPASAGRGSVYRSSRRSGPQVSLDARGRRSRRDDPAQRLITIITNHIQPLSWKVHGGRGTIVHFKGRLIVRNNTQVHQELAGIMGAPRTKIGR